VRFVLRPYQQTIVDKLRDSYRQGFRAPLLCSPVASGKMVMFAVITEAAAAMGKRITILTHRRELLLQGSRGLLEIGVQHGIISPRHSMTHDHVQVASKDTLVRRLGRAQVPDLIVLDECHHCTNGSTWGKILDYYPSAKLLGVTATPSRLDGRGLGIKSGGYFDTMVHGPSVRDLIDMGFLSRPVVFAPPIQYETKGMRKRFGDYVTSDVAERLDKPTITGCAVEHYQKLCPGAPAIAFCASVAHAEHVAAQFNAAGIDSVSVDGTLPDAIRRSRINDLSTGAIKVLASCDLISEGLDIPVVTAAILLRPTQSTGLFIQQVGRAMRIHPGKTHAIILDHVGNTLTHGLPDEEREWSLDGDNNGKKASTGEANPYVQCDNCYRMYYRTEMVCPECGHKRTVQARELEQIEGELEEIREVQRAKIQLRREEGMCGSLDELQELGRARGYKPGWAFMRWSARQKRRT